MRGPAVTCFRRDRFLFHVWCGPAKRGCLFSRHHRGGSPKCTRRRGGRRGNTYGTVCADPTGSEILGRDIGPQATNSYDDIDSYTRNPVTCIRQSLSLSLSLQMCRTRTHSHFRMFDWIHDSAVEAPRSFVPFPRRELGTSDTRSLRAEISSRPLT